MPEYEQAYEFKFIERVSQMEDSFKKMIEDNGWILEDVSVKNDEFVYKFKRPQDYLERKTRARQEVMKEASFKDARIAVLVWKYFPELADELIQLTTPDKLLPKMWIKVRPGTEVPTTNYNDLITAIYKAIPVKIK